MTFFISLTEGTYVVASKEHEAFKKNHRNCFVTVQFPQEDARIKRCGDSMHMHFIKVQQWMTTGTLLLIGARENMRKESANSSRLVAAISATLTLYKDLIKFEEYMPHSQMIKGMNLRRRNFT